MSLGQTLLWACVMETSRSRRCSTARKGKSRRGVGKYIRIILPEVLYALGEYYNEAFICVENNSHGILTCTDWVKTWRTQFLSLKFNTTR